MIDTLVRLLPQARALYPSDQPERYILVTMHRPSNVDDEVFLRDLLDNLCGFSKQVPIIFPLHPRTRQRIATAGIHIPNDCFLRLTEPLSYLEFLALQSRATAVITDSGGIQEETTFLQVPCLTMRENTERPITVICGTNTLIGRSTQRMREELTRVLNGVCPRPSVPPWWDGFAANRIAEELLRGDKKRNAG